MIHQRYGFPRRGATSLGMLANLVGDVVRVGGADLVQQLVDAIREHLSAAARCCTGTVKVRRTAGR